MSLLGLLAPRALAARNVFRTARAKPLAVAALTALFWTGCFLLFSRVLGYFQTFTALGPMLTQRLLILLFVSFFAVLLLSNLVTALTTFYLAADVPLLLAAPLPPRRLHQVRFVETLVASSWMVLLFGLPAFAAYGVVYGAGPAYAVGVIAALVPFLVIPAALGVVAATGLVLLVPARRAGNWLLVGGAVLTAGAYLAFRMLRPERLAQPSGLAGFAAFLADVGAPSPWLPTTWAAEVLLPLLGARAGTPLFHLALLGTTAGVFYLASAALSERVFLRAWSRAQEGRTGTGRERPLTRWLRRVTAPLPRVPGLLLTKDASIFFRDPAQWSQLVLLLALAVVYVYNFSVLPVNDGSTLAERIRELAALFNLGLTAFVTTAVAVRFVYPAISLEGRAWWVLRTAPVSLEAIWWSKFTIAFVPLAALGLVLVGITNRALGVSPALTAIFMATLVVLVAAIVSLGLGFGAAHPRFDTRNPAQMATGFGALVYMVTSLALIAVVVVLEAWPVARLFWHRFAGVPLGRGEQGAVGVLFALVLVLAAGTWWVGRRMALRHLAELAA
jgi:ABC-2 type transport system permease protein